MPSPPDADSLLDRLAKSLDALLRGVAASETRLHSAALTPLQVRLAPAQERTESVAAAVRGVLRERASSPALNAPAEERFTRLHTSPQLGVASPGTYLTYGSDRSYAGGRLEEQPPPTATATQTTTPTTTARRWEEAEVHLRSIGRVARDVAGAMDAAFDKVARSIVASMSGARVDLEQVWKQIAGDFATMFVRGMLEQAAQAAAKLVTLLLVFDVPKNDRLARKVGVDYAVHFWGGLSGQLESLRMGPTLATAAGPAMSSAAPTANWTPEAPVIPAPQVIIQSRVPESLWWVEQVDRHISPRLDKKARLKSTPTGFGR